MTHQSAFERGTLKQKIGRLRGRILVLGSSGFIGANLFRTILAIRNDVFGTTKRRPAWRLADVADEQVKQVDVLVDSDLDQILREVKPRTIFDCVAYGAYSFERDDQLIYETNFTFPTRLLHRLQVCDVASYVHAGSSSEYGNRSAGPLESNLTTPNSDYAVSKAAAANLIYFFGRHHGLPCANLRLYSVYGPLEDSSRLLPNVVRAGLEGRYPPFVSQNVSRDFVYIDDVVEAFVDAALNLVHVDFGDSFNIGTGTKTTIANVAEAARELFGLLDAPTFTKLQREWDLVDWFADIDKARNRLGWEPRTTFREGLARTADWYRGLHDKEEYDRASKQFQQLNVTKEAS